MANDRLIDELVDGLSPVRPVDRRRDWTLLAALGVIELTLLVVLGQARPDLTSAMTLPSFWWKIGSLGLLTIVGVVTAVRSFHPAASPRRGLAWFGGLVAAALLVGWMLDAAGIQSGTIFERLMWRHGLECVFAVVVLSIPPMVALGLLMRRGAATDLSGSALAVGSASAAWGALMFVVNCPHDDPFYVAVWYVVGCSIVALTGRMALPRIARW